MNEDEALEAIFKTSRKRIEARNTRGRVHHDPDDILLGVVSEFQIAK